MFLGAQLPGDAASRRASITELTGRSNAEIAAALSADDGYTELGELGAQHAGQIGAAYRHDCVSAHRYLADALDSPPAVKLSAPVTVVLAADDPYTADFADRHGDWQFLADQVDLYELAGGHYFLRTRPAGRPGRAASSPVTGFLTKRNTYVALVPNLVAQRGPRQTRCCPVDGGAAGQWVAAHGSALRAVVAEQGCVLLLVDNYPHRAQPGALQGPA